MVTDLKMDRKTTTIRVSFELRNALKDKRRFKPDGELETIQEVLLRLTREGGIDLKGRKIGTG